MNRREFITLGLSSAVLATMSGCSLRDCGGGMSCSNDYRPMYIYVETTPLRVFCHGSTLLFLSPKFHIIHNYSITDFYSPDSSTPLSKTPFAGLPDSLLAKGYLKYAKDEVGDDLLFSTKSQNTEIWVSSMEIVWARQELSRAEINLLDSTIEKYHAQLKKLQTQLQKYSSSSPPLRICPVDAVFWASYHTGVSLEERVPALRDERDTAYQFLYGVGMSEIYTSGSYPADFFKKAFEVDYEPAFETHARGVRNEPPKSFAWQNRPSPVKVDAWGRVIFEGKVFRPLNFRSAFADKNVS